MAPKEPRPQIPGQLSLEQLAAQQSIEAIVESAQQTAIEKATDTMSAAQARAVYGVPAKTPDVFQRRSFLITSMDAITEANKRIGAISMSSDHPKASKLDADYGGRRNDGRDRIKANAEKHDTEAKTNLSLACGQCAVEGCLLRKKYPKFLRKYRAVGDRNKFKKKLNQNPAEPC